MIHRFRPLPYLLALLLIVSSITMAVARGQMASGSEMVICSGFGEISVTLDADGNPVTSVPQSTAYPCPDCLCGLTAALRADPPAIMRLAITGRPQKIAASRAAVSQDLLPAQARGPPLLV